ncbi:MAG: hypothetical protein JJU31_14410 [Wenzhouxiangella sp.]|nr:hypothetical protein [Wenzhouxiangella sp.]MCH8477754.1 hypothetical protein [Wenzhouxiangella sp.]
MRRVYSRLFLICAFFLASALVLSGCRGPSEPDPDSSATAESDWQEDADAPMVSLFSERLHDIPMPEPGEAWVRVYGKSHVIQLGSDCSTSSEPPPADQEFAQHRFNVNFSWTMEDGRRADLGLIRAIALDEARLWRQQGHENESVSLRLRSSGARPETLDRRHYTMRRDRPGSQPIISRSHDQAPQPAGGNEQVPGIRIHPDGRRATFVGSLGRSAAGEGSAFRELEDIRVAVHCGRPEPVAY